MARTVTERQIEAGDLVHEGLSNKEIARRLRISVQTVKHHVMALLSAFDVPGRVTLAVRWPELRARAVATDAEAAEAALARSATLGTCPQCGGVKSRSARVCEWCHRHRGAAPRRRSTCIECGASCRWASERCRACYLRARARSLKTVTR